MKIMKIKGIKIILSQYVGAKSVFWKPLGSAAPTPTRYLLGIDTLDTCGWWATLTLATLNKV